MEFIAGRGMNDGCTHPDCLFKATCKGECTGYVESAVTPYYKQLELRLVPSNKANKYQRTSKATRELI